MTSRDFFSYLAQAALISVMLAWAAASQGWSWVPFRALALLGIVGSGCYVWHESVRHARLRRYRPSMDRFSLSIILPLLVLVAALALMWRLALQGSW